MTTEQDQEILTLIKQDGDDLHEDLCQLELKGYPVLEVLIKHNDTALTSGYEYHLKWKYGRFTTSAYEAALLERLPTFIRAKTARREELAAKAAPKVEVEAEKT